MAIPKQHLIFFLVVLVIFVLLVWKYYWRIQLMYNSSTLSLYTPNSFSISPQFKEEHDTITSFGFTKAKEKRVVVCALLRDIAHKFNEIKRRAESVGELFKNYQILIVENDSSDNSRSLLLEWRKENPKVVILGCGINVAKCQIPKASFKTEGHSVNRQRIEKMTHLRNIYLEYIKRNLAHYDYAIVWDMDIIGTIFLDGIANTIGHFNYPSSPAYNSDIICSYGIYRWGLVTLYYDTYAHIDYNDHFHIDRKTIHDIKKGLGKQYQRGIPPIQVISCFSGFSIYQIGSLLENDVVYDMSPPENLECEHVRLHRRLNRVHLNPSMIHFVLHNE